jgi:hypothetical protein
MCHVGVVKAAEAVAMMAMLAVCCVPAGTGQMMSAGVRSLQSRGSSCSRSGSAHTQQLQLHARRCVSSTIGCDIDKGVDFVQCLATLGLVVQMISFYVCCVGVWHDFPA